jgi:hypothetical protein
VGLNQRLERLQSNAKVLIHNNMIELTRMLHFGLGGPYAGLNDLWGVLAARLKPALKFLERWGQNEYATDLIGKLSPHLCSALPVNLKQNLVAACQALGNGGFRGAVEVAMHLGPFNEVTRLRASGEVFSAGEEVLPTMDFSRPRRACGR